MNARALSQLRWGAAAALLLAEYLLISVCFDASGIASRGGVWQFVSHIGALVPALVLTASAGILYRRRGAISSVPIEERRLQERVRPIFLVAHAGLFVAFFALTGRLFGAPEPPAGSAAWWGLGAWGLLGLGAAVTLAAGLVGSRLRILRPTRFGVAVAALGITAWLVGVGSSRLWPAVSGATFNAVATLLRVGFGEVVSEPELMTLTLRQFSVEIGTECSGLEGVGLAIVLLAGYLILFRSRLRFPLALLLLPLGVAAVWIGNTLRISSLLVFGAFVDPDVALGAFHSKAGWIFFCAIVLGVVALGSRTSLFQRDRADQEATENPTAAYLGPCLALGAVALITSAFANGLDPLYGLRYLAALIALYALRGYYRHLEFRVTFESIALGALVAVIWIGTSTNVVNSSAKAVIGYQPGPFWIAVRVAGAALIAPVCEELAFRGYLFRRLVGSDFTSVSFKAWTPLSFVGASVLFGLIHDRWLAATFAGAVYALAQVRGGRVGDAIVAHATTNALIAIWAVASGDWSAWS